MTKFHITEDGPKSCTAQPGNCPITKDTGAPHYENKEEAQAIYESQMGDKQLSSVSKKLGQRELNKLAKDSDDPQILMEAATRGSMRTKKSLTTNPNTTKEILDMMYKDSDTSTYDGKKLKDAVIGHKNFNVDSLNDQDFYDVVENKRGLILSKAIKSSRIDDDMADMLMDRFTKYSPLDAHWNMIPVVLGDNKLSDDKRHSLLMKENAHSIRNAAILQGKFPLKEFNNLSKYELLKMDISSITDDDTMNCMYDALVSKGADSYDIIRLNNNKKLSPRIIDDILKNNRAGEHETAFYTHPNISETSKRYLEAKYPILASSKKVDDISQSYGGREGLRNYLTVSKNRTSLSQFGTYNSDTVQLDKDKVQQVGLSKMDVENLMNVGYNVRARYNEETGVFTGTVDSSG